MSTTVADSLMDAVRIRRQLLADGQTVEQADRYLEGVLRSMWPRMKPWTYGCSVCSDVGLEMRWCEGLDRPLCGRTFPHDGHEYGRPCTCARGVRFRPKERTPEDFVAAGKTPKRQPTRWGSR
jgi:hypothetical protein